MWYFHLIRYLSEVGLKVMPVEIKALATPINKTLKIIWGIFTN